ncbi:MAG: PAS domain S-box protein, partial [Balneolaceae bacterium]|nr:PAS domain S-box protein [Balneolaceae bacterium]
MGKQVIEHLETFMKFHLALDGSCTEVSSQFCELLGYTEQEFREMSIGQIIHPDDRVEFSAHFDKLIAGEQRKFESTLVFLDSAGESMSFFISVILIRDEEGNPERVACQVQNLSKQEEILQKLEEREQQFNSLFRNNPHPVYYFDLEGNFEGVNEKLVEFTGYKKEELLNLSFEDFIVDEDLPRTIRHFQKAVNGESGQYEIKVHVKDGIKDIRVTKFPKYSGDEVTGVYGILQDITEEKRSKRKLERSEQLFKSLFIHNPYPIMRFSLDGQFQDANKKTVELSGFSKEELLNFDYSSFISEEDHERIATHFKKAAKGEPQYYNVKANTNNGEIEVETTLSPVYVEGEIVALFCIAKDITEEKKAKKALKRSEERWQQLVEQNPQPVQIVQDGKIIFINQVGAEYYGADSPDELIGKPILDFTHPDYRDDILERKNSLEKNQSVEPNEHKILLLNGEERYIEAHSIPITYKGEPAIQTVIHDITDLKEKEKVIGKSLKEKETMLKEIHHRVKNNLAVISSMLELQIMQSSDESAIN